ncbi:MAG: hypothetical protein WCH39_26260 [Schlesneria sp.]
MTSSGVGGDDFVILKKMSTIDLTPLLKSPRLPEFAAALPFAEIEEAKGQEVGCLTTKDTKITK